uniref:bifunctional indole-3-glycerol-phosphate synthase TrpC/phosphoribosylanthranilate isomerase TrpF n=1 Tax=Ningiella ruwaisensis TaxID=2364274 RepID=UPI00109EFE98|nr:bifunctional indole-3-glycerol-phosphate synthase TrpC/phosphoribosylanthranilate isomerase TrpF [Ningiella ruwaisensis]
MADVLAKIVADKRNEIETRKQAFPLSEFKHKLEKGTKSFIQAIRGKKGGKKGGEKAGFIFECKKASPSKGLIRENFDLREIVTSYEKEAACFSVLTDEKYFQGKFEYLEYVTSRVSQPVLNKDFFIDTYQIYLARYYRADAVLLMLSVLDDATYSELSRLCYSLGMEVLTEVSNEDETHRALALGAKIIGINNRDLRDLSTDLATTEKLVPIIRNSNFDGVIISESGIYTHQDLLRLHQLVDGFLVGSSLMAQSNLDLAVFQLAYGEVKICGVTQISDAQAIAQTQASYMGLIFAPNSPRYVSIEQAKSIVAAVKDVFKGAIVGVFVDAPLSQVIQYSHQLDLDVVQLHGNESVDYISELKPALGDTTQIWKVVSVTEQESAETLQEKLDTYIAADASIERFLLDCKIGTQVGGTGKSFDWSLLQSIELNKKAMIAGGIHPQNAKDAMQIGLSGIDVNSGVESAPGQKDITKIQALFSSLRI